MERIRNIYLPSTAITFTAVILCVSVLNLFEGCEYQNNIWILEVFGYIVFMEFMDVLICRIEFKHYLSYFFTEAVIGYVVLFGVFGYFGNWFSYIPVRILQITVMYLLILAYVHYYFYRCSKSSADEINEMLRESQS